MVCRQVADIHPSLQMHEEAWDDGLTRGCTVDSEDGCYRYVLGRTWNRESPVGVFVLLNPSLEATHLRNDRTIARCMGHARSWGWGGLRVLNLFARVRENPRPRWPGNVDPIGLHNEHAWIVTINQAPDAPIICAWGNGAPGVAVGDRSQRFGALAGEMGWRLRHFGFTQRDQPRHPYSLPSGWGWVELNPELL